MTDEATPNPPVPDSNIAIGPVDPLKAAAEPNPVVPAATDAPPWEADDFRRRVMAAGFPGSPANDPAFLAALYKFSSPSASEPASPPPSESAPA